MAITTRYLNFRRAALLVAVAALIAAALVVVGRAWQVPPAAAPDPAIRYHDALASADARYRALLERAETMPDAWTAFEWAAGAALQRARLSGSFEDYAAADALLARAFDSSEVGGPFLSGARLNYTLHRFDAALADLEVAEQRLLLSATSRREIAGLRADIAFHQGHYDRALAGYQSALEIEWNATDLFRLSYLRWQTGAFDEAERLLDLAARTAGDLDPQSNAFWHLQRGLMDLDRGRYSEALEHYRAADEALPGWWLVREHIAEIHALEGRTNEAKAIYLTVLDETGNPEFMDALAGIALSEGRTNDAASWTERARQRYLQQLELLPEAALGHAVGHFLAFSDDPDLVIALAERNRALRPGGEATLLLAQAYLKADRVADAGQVIDGLLATPWRNAELHATAPTVYRALGNGASAALQREQLLAVNPVFTSYRLGRHRIGD